MNQILILFVVGVVFVSADDEPFSIGLGVLSPSYTQTVGKEKVKVQFNQKDNGGFSYSVGDPSGTNTYLSFGERAAAAPSGESSYAAPASPTYNGLAGYAAPAPVYNSPAGYQGSVPQTNFYGNNGFQAAARKPEEPIGDIMPAGFSYHATDGQAFLGSMGESKTFMVEDSPESARGPAEESFFHQGQGLRDGLVGFGSSGHRGLPIGGYAGPQFQGAYREHGGHA